LNASGQPQLKIKQAPPVVVTVVVVDGIDVEDVVVVAIEVVLEGADVDGVFVLDVDVDVVVSLSTTPFASN